MSDRLADFPVTFHNRQYAPLMVGGMGVNISNDTLALAVEKLGGIAHLSDALLMDIADKQFGTGFCKDKIHRYKNLVDTYDKSEIAFDLDRLAESTRHYVSDVMSRKTGRGLVLINCMEKLTMNASAATLKTRLNAALDGGIDGITLSAGLHLSSMKLMQDNPRFREALIGIVVSSTRALQIFMKRAQAVNRLPDYVVVEGPLAGGHLGFGDDWAEYNLEDIVRDVVKWLEDNHFDIPVFAAGGIFTGEDAVHFVRDVGAAGVQVATRFAVTQESGLPQAVKQRYIDATDEDVQVNHFQRRDIRCGCSKILRLLRATFVPTVRRTVICCKRANVLTSRNGLPATARLIFNRYPSTLSAACVRICATLRCGRAVRAYRV